MSYCILYQLRDRQTLEVNWVGITTDAIGRQYVHKSHGRDCYFEALCIVEPRAEAERLEALWIQVQRRREAPLLNKSAGRTHSVPHSTEARRKIQVGNLAAKALIPHAGSLKLRAILQRVCR